jgi:flagellar motor switch protein FliN/FliY
VLNEEEIRSFLDCGNNAGTDIKKVQFPALQLVKSMDNVKTSMSHLEEVQVEISAELGQTEQKVREVLGLSEGSVIMLDKPVGGTVDVIMNEERFAKGEVIIINDNFGVRISAINRTQNLKLTEGLV